MDKCRLLVISTLCEKKSGCVLKFTEAVLLPTFGFCTLVFENPQIADDSGPDPRRSQQLCRESGPASSPVWARSEFNR